jgi:hypothetical protein
MATSRCPYRAFGRYLRVQWRLVLSQMCYSVTLCQKEKTNCQKIVKKIVKKNVKKLSQSRWKVVKKFSKVVKKLSKSCQKVSLVILCVTAWTSYWRRTSDRIPASTLWVSAAGKRPRAQQHMAQLHSGHEIAPAICSKSHMKSHTKLACVIRPLRLSYTGGHPRGCLPDHQRN